MDELKTWTVVTNQNEAFEVEAERVEMDHTQARTTFYVGDNPVASFVGLNGFLPKSTF